MSLARFQSSLSILALLGVSTLAGCAADATAGPDESIGAAASDLDFGSVDWTRIDKNAPRPGLFKCLTADLTAPLPWDGNFHQQVSSRDASKGFTIGNRYTGCKIDVELTDLQVSAFAGKHTAYIELGVTPTHGSGYLELTIVAHRTVWTPGPNGTTTSKLESKTLYSGVKEPDSLPFGPPISHSTQIELSEGWESVSIIANPFQTYITGSRVAPLPIAVPLALAVSAFSR